MLTRTPYSTNSVHTPSPQYSRGGSEQGETLPERSSNAPVETGHATLSSHGLSADETLAKQTHPPLDSFQHGFEPYLPPYVPDHSQTTFDPTFAFNICDFPYVPEPAQTQLSPQGSLCQPWSSSELDNWIGIAVPQAADPTYQCQDMMLHAEHTAGTLGIPSHGAFDLPMVASTADTQQPHMGATASTWTMEHLAPIAPTVTACNGSVSAEGRHAQREVLLAAVDRLVQLAALMQ